MRFTYNMLTCCFFLQTTLMDVIAGYKTGGKITGDILIDSKPKDENTWKKISGYAEQNDILNPYLTVIETLRFTASCRLPHNMDKEERVQQILELMDLKDYANHVIGREQEGEGLEKHVRKRVTIAVQLVIRPRVLFLDEPVSVMDDTILIVAVVVVGVASCLIAVMRRRSLFSLVPTCLFRHEQLRLVHSNEILPSHSIPDDWARKQCSCTCYPSCTAFDKCHGHYNSRNYSSAVQVHLGDL